MARQSGSYYITGTFDNLCFYKMEGRYYVRTKSSLTGKRVKKDPAFMETMHYAGLLAGASKIASAFYKKMDDALKVKGLYRKLTGEVMQLLKSGATQRQVVQYLERIYRKATAKQRPVACKSIAKQFWTQTIVQAAFTERLPEYFLNIPVHTASPP